MGPLILLQRKPRLTSETVLSIFLHPCEVNPSFLLSVYHPGLVSHVLFPYFILHPPLPPEGRHLLSLHAMPPRPTPVPTDIWEKMDEQSSFLLGLVWTGGREKAGNLEWKISWSRWWSARG